MGDHNSFSISLKSDICKSGLISGSLKFEKKYVFALMLFPTSVSASISPIEIMHSYFFDFKNSLIKDIFDLLPL